MKNLIFFFVYICTVTIVTGQENGCYDCSGLYTTQNINGTLHFFLKRGAFPDDAFPLEIHFDAPIPTVKSTYLEISKNTSKVWKLDLPMRSSSLDGGKNPSFTVSKSKGIEICTITSSSKQLCGHKNKLREIKFTEKNSNISFVAENDTEYIVIEDIDIDESDDITGRAASNAPKLAHRREATLCIQRDPKTNPDVLEIQYKATWRSGRNIKIDISSVKDFTGYIVEVFFDKPVTKILDIGEYPNKHLIRQFSPVHWALTRRFRDRACQALIEVYMEISYPLKEVSKVRAVALNGNFLEGNGSSSAILGNKLVDNALSSDCQKMLEIVRCWYGETTSKACDMIFEARISSPKLQLGVVVDFIFEQDIVEIREWNSTTVSISGNHKRIHNYGWVIPPMGTVSFPMAVYYVHHYHVKIVGVAINGEVLCGLGVPTAFILHNNLKTQSEAISEQNVKIGSANNQLLATIIMMALSIVISVVVFTGMLHSTMRSTLAKRKHLYDFPARSNAREQNTHPNLQRTQSATSNTYSTVM